MTIRVGTIQEMTGEGYELLVDLETRSFVLARFFDGKMVGAEESPLASQQKGNDGPTQVS